MINNCYTCFMLMSNDRTDRTFSRSTCALKAHFIPGLGIGHKLFAAGTTYRHVIQNRTYTRIAINFHSWVGVCVNSKYILIGQAETHLLAPVATEFISPGTTIKFNDKANFRLQLIVRIDISLDLSS